MATTATGAKRVAALGLRGCALVVRDGADLVRYAGGTTGSDPDGPIGLETRFQLASVSKQFTAAATLLLVDRGLLQLDDRVVDLLEGCPAAWRQITVHHLLCHSAGLVHWQQLDGLDLTARIDGAELLARFARAPLHFSPGTRHEYSSPGYVLLASIVERVAGRPYGTFLESELFGPLGMDVTFVGNGAGEDALAAPLERGRPVASFELDVVGKGAGDAWSTVEDLVRWDAALGEGRLLSSATRAAMFEPQAPVVDRELEGVTFYAYGYGWYLGDVLGHRAVFHPGDNAGFQALNLVFPDDDACVVVLTNEAATDLLAVALELAAVATGEGPTHARGPAPRT